MQHLTRISHSEPSAAAHSTRPRCWLAAARGRGHPVQPQSLHTLARTAQKEHSCWQCQLLVILPRFDVVIEKVCIYDRLDHTACPHCMSVATAAAVAVAAVAVVVTVATSAIAAAVTAIMMEAGQWHHIATRSTHCACCWLAHRSPHRATACNASP
jgi:Zn finger protein HypA/HybF involved in hydrogenase expression